MMKCIYLIYGNYFNIVSLYKVKHTPRSYEKIFKYTLTHTYSQSNTEKSVKTLCLTIFKSLINQNSNSKKNIISPLSIRSSLIILGWGALSPFWSTKTTVFSGII